LRAGAGYGLGNCFEDSFRGRSRPKPGVLRAQSQE